MKFNHTGFDVSLLEPLQTLSVLPPPADLLTGVVYHRTCDVALIVKWTASFCKHH